MPILKLSQNDCTSTFKSDISRYKTYFDCIKKRKVLPEYFVPIEVEIELTLRCNERCYMCEKWRAKKKQDILTTKRLRSLFDELIKIGVKAVVFSGGEPLLRKDFVELVEYASKAGLQGTVITNGSLITNKIAKSLLTNKWNVYISIDGSKPGIIDSIRNKKGIGKKVIAGTKKNCPSQEKIWWRKSHGSLRATKRKF